MTYVSESKSCMDNQIPPQIDQMYPHNDSVCSNLQLLLALDYLLVSLMNGDLLGSKPCHNRYMPEPGICH